MNPKIISALVSMAFISVVVYVSALLHTEPLHEFQSPTNISLH